MAIKPTHNMNNFSIITTASFLTLAVIGVVAPTNSFAANQSVNAGSSVTTNSGISQLSTNMGFNSKKITAEGTNRITVSQMGSNQTINAGVTLKKNVGLSQLAAFKGINDSNSLALALNTAELDQCMCGNYNDIKSGSTTLANLLIKQQAFENSKNLSDIGVGSSTDSKITQAGSWQSAANGAFSEANITVDQYAEKDSTNTTSISSSSTSIVTIKQY
jgi:hypothetical protein